MELTGDIIDTRELAKRATELEEEQAELEEEGEDLDKEDADELDEIETIRMAVADFEFGAQLIDEDYFEEYAKELAEDIGAVEDSNRWPATCIDWARAARELQQDYTTVTYRGTDYYVR